MWRFFRRNYFIIFRTRKEIHESLSANLLIYELVRHVPKENYINHVYPTKAVSF